MTAVTHRKRPPAALAASVAVLLTLGFSAATPRATAQQYWDGPNANNAVTEGGNGVWDSVTTNWTDVTGTVNNPYDPALTAFFGVTPGTVTLGNDLTFTNLTFQIPGYIIAGGAGPFTLTPMGTGILNALDGASGRINAQITGANSLTIQGAGTGSITLANVNNDYAGGTTLESGILFVDATGALGTGPLTITSPGGNAILATAVNGTTIANAISVQGDFGVAIPGGNLILTGNVDLNGATRTITGLTFQGQLQFSGGGISNGGLTLATTFTAPGDYMAFIFNNPNTYTGLTTVGNGAFLVFQGGTVNGAVQGNVLVEGNGVVDFLGGASEQISNTSTVTVNSLGNSANGLAFGGFDLFSAMGTETIGSLFGNGTVWVANSTLAVGSGNFTGVISDGTHTDGVGGPGMGAPLVGGGLTKYGAGTLILSGANIYTGLTTISGGTLQAGAANTFSPNSAFLVGSAGTLSLNNFNQNVGSIANGVGGGGTISLGSGTLTTGNNNTSTSFSGTIVGTGGLTKAGTGTFTVSGANTYSGFTSVSQGTLRAGAVNTVPLNSAVFVNGAATFNLNNFNQSVGALADGVNGGGTVNLGTASMTTGNGNFTSTFSGTINGTGGLTKVGTGTFFLNGTNNYTGITAVNGGALVLNSNLGAPVIVSNGSEFDINRTGSVRLGNGVTAVTANNGELVNNAGNIVVGNNATAVRAVANNTINNTGNITGGATGSVGVEIAGAGNTLTNGGNGTITAETAVLITSPSGDDTVVNYGTLTGTGGVAVRVTSGASVSLTNIGTINGSIIFNSGNDTLTLVTGIPTNGALNGAAGTDTLRLVGTGSDTLDLDRVTNFEILRKLGGGTWTVTGTSRFSGGTTVELGEFYVQGNLISNVSVFADGFLGGRGTITGAVLNAGIVSPGNSIDRLTIKGDYTQAKSGTLVIEVNGKNPGQYDVLAVSGRADLDGKLRIQQVGRAPRLKIGERIAFLTADQGVSGKFDDVENPFATGTMIRAEVVYKPNAVVLEGTQGSFAQFAREQKLTPNQRSTAQMIDKVAFGRGERKLIDYLNNRLLNEIPRDLDRIAPEELTAVYRVGVALADVQSTNLQRRMEEVRLTSRRPKTNLPTAGDGRLGAAGVTGPSGTAGKTFTATEPEDRWGVFFTGVGQVTRVGSTENARGYDLDTGGLTVGVDYRVSPNLAVGVHAGYANTGADLFSGGRVSINTGKIGAYATYFTGGYYLDGAVTTGYNSYETQRAGLGGKARGRTDGIDFSAMTGTGYDWKFDEFTIGPTATLQYTRVSIDEFTERGSLAPLNIPDQHEDSFSSTLGFHMAYEWKLWGMLVRPDARAGWRHEYADSSFEINSRLPSGSGGLFAVQDSEIGRNSFLLGAGVSVLLKSGTLMYLHYDGELSRQEYNANNLSGGVRLTF